jgi:5-methylcytosine-specific restriction endonuclease McrA
MSQAYSQFILWFRMQSLRQDAVGAMVCAVHADQTLFSMRMYHDIRRHLHQTESHSALLPAFYEAEQEYARYHRRQFDDMPCLLCRSSLTVLPREDVDVIWQSQAGLEGNTYGFLHKPCFVKVDQPGLDVETLDRLLSPQHGYRQRLTPGWRDALIRLWPPKKLVARRTVVIPAPKKTRERKKEPSVRIARQLHAREIREVRKLASRFAILQRDKFRCRLCGVAASDGEHVRLEVDHIIPRSKGGGNETENRWTLCFECNRGKGAKLL